MYFKELKLFGFKSFAEETTVKFEPGVTAVVGPNGCGKSNIADAVKWVLGEQSAKEVRGSSMEDVIFNGTAGVEPVNMAEVSLTILNQDNILPIDYDEVTITRRVYRSGESNYFVNKSKVRLKDIQDIIMGTGIGKSSYSIMEQGKIDLVLSSKPQDRRYIFEEASGITKYKSKKKETLNKLERTQENLQRVNDIVQEVERQLNSIQRKVNKAQRYKNIYEKLEKCELVCNKNEYLQLKENIGNKACVFKDYEDKLEQLESEISGIKNKLNLLRSNSGELEGKLDLTQNKLVSLTSKIKETESRTDLCRARIKDLNEKIENLDSEDKFLNLKLEETSKNLYELEEATKRIEQEKEDIFLEKKTFEERMVLIEEELAENNKKIDEIKINLVDKVNEETGIKNELVRIDSDIKNFGGRFSRLNSEKNNLSNESENLKSKMENLKSDFENVNKSLCLEEEKLNKKKQQKQQADLNFEAIESKISQKKSEFESLQSKLELFKQLKDKYEGFSSSIKGLVDLKEERDLKFQILADVISVDEGYQQAVESALGEDVQALIADTSGDAAKLIDVLDSLDEGKCRIIVLDEFLTDSDFNPDFQQNVQVKGKLSDYARASSDKYNALIKSLFNGKFLVDDRQVGIRNSSLSNRLTEFVTLKGEIFKHGSFLTKSSKSKKEFGLIGRQETITNLKNQIKEVQIVISEKEKEASKLKNIILDLENSLTHASESVENLKSKKINCENQMGNFNNEFKRIEEDFLIINSETKEVEEQLSSLKKQKEEFSNKANTVSCEVEEERNLINSCQNSIVDLNKERETLMIETSKLDSRLSGIEERSQSNKEKIEMFSSMLKENKEKMDFAFSQKNDSRNKIHEFENELKKYEENFKEYSLAEETLNKELSSLRLEKEEFNKKRISMESLLEERQTYLESEKQGLQNLNMERTETEYKIEQISNRIKDKYNKNLNEFEIPEEYQNEDKDKLKQDIKVFSSKLESMGPVNLMAIEEHEELKERHSFLIEQREDLLKAEESLRKAIKKINHTTKSLFIETFEKIREEFDIMFKTLFGGGKAVIYLEDENDVLESGIMINVQPKGKKLQNISLLSGGEKTMTAVALLFAVFKVKPSPFCLLDEIDAALDEANIDRFSRLLKEFTQSSQFIIITHNKKTISLADVIYGVTMEKSGISKLVSVKLVEKSRSEELTAVE